jgi:hypothetical protein
MYCSGCNQELSDSFFLKNQSKCYKCIYKEKKILLLPKTPKKRCQNCNKYFLLEKGFNKRKIYCSKECATIYWKKQQKNYWTRKIQRDYQINKNEVCF